MTKKSLVSASALLALATIFSCDSDSSQNGSLDSDCPIGTFRPVGLADCVFPAEEVCGGPLAVPDNRCASGQPALPPACVNDQGGRSYFSQTKSCAPGYRFAPGACQRDGGPITGAAGGFGTGMSVGTAN